MAFSVSRSRPFRSLGLYKSSGKHAAPKGAVPAPRRAPEVTDAVGTDAVVTSEQGAAHHPAHAATSPRLTTPGEAARHSAGEADSAEKTAA